MSASRGSSDSDETPHTKAPVTKPAKPKAKPARKPASRSSRAKSGGTTRSTSATRKPAARKPARKSASTGTRGRTSTSAQRSKADSIEVTAEAKGVKAEQSSFESAWEKAQAAAQARREKQPDVDVTELYRQLLRDKCLRAGTLGAATSVASMVPGLGTIASFAIDGIGDAAYTAELQHDLALTTFALYGREPNEKERLRIAAWIATFGAGGSELIEQVGKMVARQLAKNLAGRLLRRGLPFAEVAYSTATHLAGTYFVGRRAQLYCIGLSDAESEILLESEKGIKLQVRRMKKLAEDSVEAMEERFGRPGRTLAILFRKLTGSEKD